MRTNLLLAAVIVLFAASILSAEHIDLGTIGKDLNLEVLESNDQQTVVKFEIGGFDREAVNINGEEYFQLRLMNESYLLNEAEPELPRVCRSIIIPDDAQMKISVVASEYVDYHQTLIVPSKGNLLRTVNPDDVPYTFGPVYSENAFYPASLAEIREPFVLRDYRGTVIELNPFRYNPATQTLRVYTMVTVKVENVGPGQINVLENADRSRVVADFNLLYERRFINYSFMADKYTLLTEEGDMLIICHGPFMAAMDPFVQWKLQKGIKTTIVNVSDIGNTSTAIDAYIDSFFNAPANELAWVLLVGDYAQVTSPQVGGAASDPSYGKILYSDDYPDVIIGRFSAETIADVNTQVERAITYEQNPVAGDWFHKGFGVASSEGAGIGHNGEADYVHIGYIRDDLLGFTYTLVDELYATNGATAAMVSAALNEGRSIGNYCGHGSITSWSTTGFSNTHVNALVNDNMLPFIISVACNTGEFDGYTTCFGEAWLRATNSSTSAPTGAIGFYGSTISQSWAPPMWCQDEANDLLVAMTKTTFGGMCYNGSAYMIEVVGAGGITESNAWTIFGDPSLVVRTDVPAALTVNYPGAVFFNVPSVEVEVVGEEGMLCALYHDGVLYGSGYTNSSGIATITLDQSLPIGGSVTLTVTGFNKATFTGTIQAASDLAIVHTELPDTKDTLNDYEVNATLYSSNTIIADSVLLHYEINSVWTTVTMSQLKIVQEDFVAYIPAQQAGTTINYYMTAKNEDNFYDTTELFSFMVIDYAMLLEPGHAIMTAPVDDTVWYPMTVTNDGVLADDYSLSVVNDTWPTTIWDAAASSQISSTGTLYGDDAFDFKIRVIVPASLEGESDSINVIAASTANAPQQATAIIKTISAGMPWPIPFTEYFATTSFDMTKWETVNNVTINDIGIAEPSAPYSANLNGDPSANDMMETEAINLKDESNIILKYYYEQTGGGESPDGGDDLKVEYLDLDSNWVLINTHLGADADMTTYDEVELALPGDAMHANFRLRFSCTATSGAFDDWFVDDIYVGHPSDYDVMITPSFQSEYGPAGDSAAYTLTIKNKGFLDDNFDLTSTGSWNVTFFDAAGTTQITESGTVTGGDSIDIVVKIEVPPGTPLHVTSTSTVFATSQGDGNMQSYALLETISAGFPATIPWYEIFPEDTLYTQRWFTFDGVAVSTAGQNPPSAPYSFHLDGGIDTATTQLIGLGGQTGVLLSYYYECGGLGDVPEAGDNLWIDYRNSTGAWVNLITHEGGSAAMTEFEYVSLELPPDAHHNSLQLRFRTYGSGAGQDSWFVDDIRVDYAPAMAVTPTGFNQTLVQGDSALVDMIIDNSGMGGLLYNLELIPHLRSGAAFARINDQQQFESATHDYPDEVYVTDLPKGEDIVFSGYPVRFNMGGPDNYGYYWLDSDESGGPTFDWVDISATGTDVISGMSDDSYVGPFDLGFDFIFYGRTYSQVYIGSNGIVGFTEDGMNARISQPIPTSYTPNAMLALVWDDLNPADSDNPDGHLYYGNNGGNFVIQFVDYPEYRADPGDVITAEVIIKPDGTIKFQYLDIASGFDVNNCTVGIENHDGNDGLEVTFHASYLKNGLAVEFFKPYDWLVMDKFEGEIPAGGADTIHCKFLTSTELDPGTYTGDIIIHNNDPVNDPMTIGAQLEVLEYQPYICGDASGDEIVNVSDAVYIINYIFTGGDAPDPLESADVNCDSDVNVSDAVSIINYIFSGGNDPCDSDGDGIPDC
jgi:hypothetical protein